MKKKEKDSYTPRLENPLRALRVRQFLDLAWEDVVQHPGKLIPYTHKLDAELDDLLAEVEVGS